MVIEGMYCVYRYKEQGAEKEDTDRLIHRLKGSVLRYLNSVS